MTAVHDPPSATTVTRHAVGRRSVLAVSGEIDLATAPAVTTAIERELGAGALELWVDLTGTSFLDSSGVHALLQGHRRALELNRRLVVICPDGSPRRVLELVGAVGHLPVFRDRAAAHRAG
jgi:anti-sigma B factor antagonist